MSGLSLYCAGVIDTAAVTCSTGWQAVVAEQPFDLTQLDPVVLVTAFATGFFLLSPVWVVCYGAGEVLKFIRR